MAALGLGAGLIWEASATTWPPQVDPTSIGGMILWLDFSDASTMYTTHDSFNSSVSSDGDAIGRIHNKSMLTYSLSNNLGIFAKQAVTSRRPLYKTSGAGGHSYGLFDGVDSLFCTSVSADTGSIGAGVLSSTELDMQSYTMVIIAASTVADITAPDNIFSIRGHEPGDTSTYRRMRFYKHNPTDGFNVDHEYEGESTEDINGGATNANNTSASVHFFIGGTTSTGVSLAGSGYGDTFKNNGGTQTAETLANDAEIDFAPGGSYSGDPDAWQVGNLIGTDGSEGTSSLGFAGKIYEVVMYNNPISASNRIGLANYYMDKYSI